MSGKTKADFGHGAARFVPYTNVFDNPLTDVDRLESVEIDPHQHEIRYGDVFFTVSSETPEEVGMSSLWLSDQRNVYLNSFCFGYRQDGSFDSLYLAYALRSKGIRRNLTLLAQGISRFNISKNKVMELSIPTPQVGEQRAIGALFSRLDDLITLRQRELEHVKEMKRGLLQKMFPKAGADVPEMRFPGFTDPWEQRKLGEVADINPPSTLPDSFEYVDLESVAGTEMVFHRTEARATAPLRAQRLAEFGDIFFQTVRPYQKNNYLFELPDKDFVFSTGYAQLRPICSSRFLFPYLQRDAFVNQVLDRCTGTGYPAINANDLANIDVSLPSSGEEQSKIGVFFRNVDDLITLRQRELEHTKLMKKALLQQMFV